MTNFLVTGANGFIGLHLIERLLKEGHTVTALDMAFQNLPSEWSGSVKKLRVNITEKNAIIGVFKDVDIVIHLASKVHDLSIDGRSDAEYFKINVNGTANLLNECKNSNVQHFVFMSSVKAMADDVAEGLNEQHAPNPTTPYGRSKLEAEYRIADHGSAHGLKTTSIRLPVVYGPGNKGNIYRMMAAIDKHRFMMIGRGNNKRSMVFVGNVIDALMKASVREAGGNKLYIVTDEIDYAVRELYNVIAKALGRRPFPFAIPMLAAKTFAKAGDFGEKILHRSLPFNSSALAKLTSSFTFSSLKVQKELCFRSRYDLHNTINNLVNWYRTNDGR